MLAQICQRGLTGKFAIGRDYGVEATRWHRSNIAALEIKTAQTDAISPCGLFNLCEHTMTSNFEPTVIPAGESAGLFDAACDHVRVLTQARCALVVVIDGELGSGYSVIGPLEAQVLLPDILQKIADTLRGQLSKNLQ
jgi:hypothetical protein